MININYLVIFRSPLLHQDFGSKYTNCPLKFHQSRGYWWAEMALADHTNNLSTSSLREQKKTESFFPSVHISNHHPFIYLPLIHVPVSSSIHLLSYIHIPAISVCVCIHLLSIHLSTINTFIYISSMFVYICHLFIYMPIHTSTTHHSSTHIQTTYPSINPSATIHISIIMHLSATYPYIHHLSNHSPIFIQ